MGSGSSCDIQLSSNNESQQIDAAHARLTKRKGKVFARALRGAAQTDGAHRIAALCALLRCVRHALNIMQCAIAKYVAALHSWHCVCCLAPA